MTLKTTSSQVHYFSAYPLKALNLPEETEASDIVVPIADLVLPVNRIRIAPMVNPYKERDFREQMHKTEAASTE